MRVYQTEQLQESGRERETGNDEGRLMDVQTTIQININNHQEAEIFGEGLTRSTIKKNKENNRKKNNERERQRQRQIDDETKPQSEIERDILCVAPVFYRG